jgi:hypothetical protein
MGDASFSCNVSVGLGITANSLTTNDLLTNSTISALAGISSGGDIISSSAGENNVGTSESPWGGLNTLTASLGDATTTTLSNSRVILLNSGDGDKVILTSVGSTGPKITLSAGWGVNYHAGYTGGVFGQHTFWTGYNGGWNYQMYINTTAVNITNRLAVNQSVDSGNGRGIYWWNDGDPSWTSYFASSGAGKTTRGSTACTSLDGRMAHHHRARVGNSATQGFLWENNGEACLMSLTADTGNLYVRSLIQTSNINVEQTLTAGILKGSLDYNYLSNVPSLATSAQGSFDSITSVWSSNNCVKGSTLQIRIILL